MQHKDNCLRVAARAGLKSGPAGRRKHWLAVVFDETCRKAWADRAYAESDFDINEAACKLDTDLLQIAEDKFDSICEENRKNLSPNPKGNGKGKYAFNNNKDNSPYQRFPKGGGKGKKRSFNESESSQRGDLDRSTKRRSH